MKTIQSLTTCLALFFALIGNYSFAQLTVNNGFTAQQLGNNLAGSNVNVVNASITGDPDQYGQFQYVGNDLGLNSGVILSTGDIFDAVGPNSSGSTSSNMGGAGDPDLTALAGFNTNDAVVFEFDFEVQGDEIEFNFVFLSEEYNEFVNSGFNDVFAFYISGPGIVGQENLAIVPGTTTPVTINTINNGSFWQFYNDNTSGAVNVEFDGFTTLMTAMKSGLQECGVYTLSLRIADGSDSALDSGVLLQENSLVQSNISASSTTFSGNNTALEGCIDASFTFQLDSVLTQDVDIPIGIGGTATNGVDYSQIDTIITIPAGQLSATIIIDAIADGITEGQEVVELYYTPFPCQPEDTIFMYIDDYVPLEYNIFPTDVTCNGAADGQVDITVSGGLAPYTLTLTDSITGDQQVFTSFPVTGLDVGTYYVEIIDGYGCSAEDLVAGNLFDAGQTFLPDGTGASYQTDLTISGFSPGQTLVDVNQIVSICATMEHSYANDLTIVLQAPNGSQVTLKNSGPTGGAINACNLGEPVASGPVDNWNASNITPGIGYQYCWSANATYSTMSNIIQAGAPGPPPQYTYTTLAGNTYTDYYLPAGSYTPAQNFNAFIGTELNGVWSMIITDNYALDNGYIFDWSISLQADIPDSIFTIEQPDLPNISETMVQPNCGASDGSIDLTVTGGVPPFTFLWNTGATTEDISGIGAGTYTVDITDDSLCTYTHQVNLSNNGTLVIAGNITNETCAGNNDGAIDISLTGTAPYTFSWDNGATTEDISGLAPGDYTVNVTDAAGCQGLMTFTVDAAPNINISASIINENCGDQEGEIDITVLGAANPASFLWSNGLTTEDLTDLVQGTYSVEITDANGCYATDTFSIINLVGNCVPQCDLSITNATVSDEVCGDGAGSIDLTLFSTNGPIAISWDNGATTEDIFGLSQGNYEVTLTDNEGCLVVQTYAVNNNTGTLSIDNIFTTNEYCGNGQGGADATISGGALPYTYSWDNGATTEDISGVTAGTYTLTVTDANGCSAYSSVTIVNDAGTLAQTYGNAVDEICGNSNGSIDIVITGGVTPYTYLWTNGATTEDLINIPSGTYTCTVTDAGGCSITTDTYVVNNQSGGLQIDYIDVDNEICGNGLGEIVLTLSGGTLPYSILWNTGATTQTISNLSAATYDATITDSNGCSVSTGNLVLLNESGTLSLDGISTFDEVCGNGTGAVNISISGGTAPYSYQWSNGSTSPNLTNVSAGNYTCTVTDANGCTVIANGIVNNDPGVLSIDNIIVTNETCGNVNGALDLILSGAANPVTYVWSNGGTTQDLSGIAAGTYTVDITDNNGCTANSQAIVINDAGTLNLDNVQVSNEICGNGAGSIDLTVSGGVAPITYSWDSGQTTEDITGLSSGTFTCTITDNTGCSIVAGPYNVNNGSGGLTATIDAVTDETCGNNGGAIDATISGGTAPYTISWSSGQTTEDISGLASGNYVLTVTDANGCTTTASADVVNNPGSLAISNISVTDESCGNGSGMIDITVSGGTPGYSYNWSNGPTSEDITGLSQGTYSVTVSDANGCVVNSGNIAVNNFAGSFTVDAINVTNENCGDGTGSIDIVISGAAPGTVLYSWSNGSTTQDISGLSAGTYTGTATDVAGCVVNFSATVLNDPGSLNVSDAITMSTCNGSNGDIDLTVTGGTAPYTFVWSNGATTEDIAGLNAGTFICNITDASGCSATYQGTVSTTGNPSITGVNVTDETCGSSDGSITVSVSGGTGPYSYNWTAPVAPPCCTYTLDMQDQGNSWNGASIDVFINGSLQGNYTVPGGGANVETFPVCDGDTIELFWNSGAFDNEVSFDLLDGSGTIVFSQGASPTPGSIFTGTASCAPAPMNGPTISNLSAGTYSVVVTDAFGCQDSVSVNVNNSSGTLQITNAVTQDETCSDINGSIDITVSGTGPFTYNWDNGATTEDISGLAAGTYMITVSNPQGCTVDGTYSLANIDNGLAITAATVTDETCADGSGAIDITTVGGFGPLSYDWSNGSTAEDLVNLSAGTYTVTISDGSICTVDSTFNISNNANGMAATTAVTDATCGSANGAIDITVTGGTAPLTFLWNTGATTEDLTVLIAGTYTCTVTDNTGCQYIITETVVDSNGGLSTTANITDEDCGGADGEIDLTISGGTGPYTVAWNNGATSEDLVGLTYGMYSVTVTDANGCSITDAYNVASGGTFNYTATITNETCGGGNGEIDLTFTGGFPGNPDDVLWNTGATTQDITNLSSGWYVIEMIETGFGACTMVDSFYVGVDQGTLSIDSILTSDENCTLANGTLDAFVSGGTSPLAYVWSNGATTEDISGLSAGTYVLTVTDANGCIAEDSASISNFTFGLGVAGASITDETCGDASGAIDITATGGTGPYTYNWSSGATIEDPTGLSSGAYTVTVTDNTGCTVNATFNVGNNTNGFVITSTVVDETCGTSNGIVDLTTVGGVAPITYSWSNGATTEDILGLDGGTYTCTISDNSGCTIVVTETVTSYSENFAIGTPIVVDEDCGDGSGSITLNPTGGTAPYTYSWNLPAGCCAYTLNMYDLNNNGWGGNPIPEVLVYINGSLYGNFTVPTGNGNSFNSEIIPVCEGDLVEFEYVEAAQNQNNTYEVLDASGNVVFSDGPNPFNGIAFTTNASCNPGNVNQITGLSAGTYPVEITDDIGCVILDTITVNNNTGTLAISNAVINDQLCSNIDGAIDITVTGGANVYTYSWNTGDTTEDLTGLTAGTYTVTVTDTAGCALTESYTVGVTTGTFTISNVVISEENCGNGAGAIDLTIAGGVTPYVFNWSNGATTEDLTGLNAGTYTVTVDDAGGCQIVDSFVVINNTGTLAITNPIVSNEICGDGAGAVDITVTGGTAPITINWDNGATTEDITGLSAGTYIVDVTDSNGCMVSDTFVIINNSGTLSIDNAVITNETCESGDGAIDITVSGGALPYTFSWSNAATTEDITGLSAGSYDVTVTDNTGCSVYATYPITNTGSAVNVLNTTVVHATCATCTDGSIDLDMDPAGAPYTYSWSNGETIEDISNLIPGTYTVTITNADGCTTMIDIEILDTAHLDEFDPMSVLVAPNPSMGVFNLNYENVIGDRLTLTLFDATGRLIWESNISVSESNGSHTLDFSEYSSGTYMLNIASEQMNVIKRLMIKR